MEQTDTDIELKRLLSATISALRPDALSTDTVEDQLLLLISMSLVLLKRQVITSVPQLDAPSTDMEADQLPPLTSMNLVFPSN